MPKGGSKGKPFWSYVDFWGPKTDRTPTRCWVWTGACNGAVGHRSPYGTTWDRKQQKRVKAHRLIWEHVHGPIPNGLVIDHLCRTTLCVRPSHLEPVTVGENNLRGTSPSYVSHRTGVCPRGHEFTPENTYNRPDGHRTCRACHREVKRRYKQRQKLKGCAI